MTFVYLTCPACRGKFNARKESLFAFCPFCSRRVETVPLTEDEIRELFIRTAVKCNRQCERTGYKCRCGCVVEVFQQQ
ncbi:MAG: hypothetical protein MJZ38_07775 [archaeon]|nr:hypothetical protein [archaeon]